jgi:hypothetical protein
MKVSIDKPGINVFLKSYQFFISDYRKILSLIACLLIPIINNAWKLLPQTSIDFYPSLQVLGWTISIHLMSVFICIAWWFSINKKDYVLQIFSLSIMGYCLFLTYSSLPFTANTPFWQDLLSTAFIFSGIYASILFIKNCYCSSLEDYKTQHDGLVYDLHHHRFLASVSRIEGLVMLQDTEIDKTSNEALERYNKLLYDEVTELKKSFIYINEKYDKLS